MFKSALVTSEVAVTLGKENAGKRFDQRQDDMTQTYLGIDADPGAVHRVRERLHWITAQADGGSVLDVRTGEGILPILLGREGFHTLGIDADEVMIDLARQRLAQEPEAVRERVEFHSTGLLQTEGKLDFDNVLLNEVIERSSNIRQSLHAALSHLKEGGKLILSAPFGVMPGRSRKHSIFPGDLYHLLEPHGRIELMEIVKGDVRAVLIKGEARKDEVPTISMDLLRLTERGTHDSQVSLWHQIDAVRGQAAQLGEERDLLHRRLNTAEGSLASTKEDLKRLEQELMHTTRRLHDTQTELRRERAQASDFRSAEIGLRDELNAALERQRPLKARLAQAEAQRDEARQTCAEAEAELRRLVEELGQIRDLRKTEHRHSERPSGLPGGALPALALTALVEACDLPVARIADACTELSRERLSTSPEVARLLAELACEIDPGPRRDKMLGLALLHIRDPEAARVKLEALPAEVELSSLEQRQITALQAAQSAQEVQALSDLAERPLVRSRLRVATIMDDFTYNSYAPECDLMQLTPDNWMRELAEFRPEMLFVESAWRGKGEAWGSKVGHLSSEVQDIVDWCRQHDVPTLFWNKEDPIHFETFLTTAAEFDVVCTTDIDRIGAYKAALGHDRVYLLPFGCQPEVHNPIEIYDRKDAFCFAGAYYVRYPDRTRDLEGFVEALPAHRPIEIFDRNFGKDHPDYMFPEAYATHIVGTLAPSEIDRAYKGYRFGINLNSIKESQTMFARRVYELLASNTITVSNYSRGLRLMFGDLVLSSDSGAEILRRVSAIDTQERGPRLRLAGLRKTLSEHTYAQRLNYVATKLGLDCQADVLPGVSVICRAETEEEARRLVERVAAQECLVPIDLVLVLGPRAEAMAENLRGPGRTVLPEQRAKGLSIGDLVPKGNRVAGMVAADHYGPSYLQDLILTLRYASHPVIGKVARHEWQGDAVVAVATEAAYRPAPEVELRCALVTLELLADQELIGWLLALPETSVDGTGQPVGPQGSAAPVLAIDPFNYCRNGSSEQGVRPGVCETIDDLADLDLGLSIQEMIQRAEATSAMPAPKDLAPTIAGAELAASIKPLAGLSWVIADRDWVIRSELGDGKHAYLYQNVMHRLEKVAPDGNLKLYLDTSPGLSLYWTVLFLDTDKQKISHKLLTANRNHSLEAPEGTVWLRFGLRVYGGGHGTIRSLVLGERQSEPIDVLGSSQVLVLTNHYPSYEDLYRNGFVHRRLKAYRERGLRADLYRLRPEQALSYHEFEDIDCISGSAEQLDRMLSSGRYKHVLVHFLDQKMWEVLARHVDRIRVTVWVHGAEIQPWHRRAFNYTTAEEIEAAKPESDRRMAFWRGILGQMPDKLHLVFVSQYCADAAQEDLKIDLPSEVYSIIHNPIDSNVFSHVEKSAKQRLNILSVRPYASRTYANDLTIEAILKLRSKPFFDELSFRLIGDGPLFEQVVAPIQGIPNVTLERNFLPQGTIADLHRDYGVFLSPSRMDTQGVSRDEAMSSGLVPVTNRVAAISEFVDENCGYLADPEDAEALAAAIEDIYASPDKFLRLSAAAAARVRKQSGSERICLQELQLINDPDGSISGVSE